MEAANVNDFIISTVEEEIFLFVNYAESTFEQSTYIKICFRLNEKFPTNLLKKKSKFHICFQNFTTDCFFILLQFQKRCRE